MLGVDVQRQRFWGRVFVAVAALALLAAGCGDDDDAADEGTTTTAEPTAELLEVNAVDFGFEDLPEELPGGAVEFKFINDGEVDHEIVFAEIGDTELDQFLTDFAPVLEGGPTPDYVVSYVGGNEAPAGESATFTYTLPEGTYAAFCTLTGTPDDPEAEDEPHYELGMKQLVEVIEPVGATDLPEGDGSITAEDYTFETDLEGGDGIINFTNTGPDQAHFAGVDVYPEGTTVEEAEAAFETLVSLEEGEAPPEDTLENEPVGFSGVATPGNDIQFTVPGGFESGRTYIFYCFISDRTGGPPHAIGNKMYKAVTIE